MILVIINNKKSRLKNDNRNFIKYIINFYQKYDLNHIYIISTYYCSNLAKLEKKIFVNISNIQIKKTDNFFNLNKLFKKRDDIIITNTKYFFDYDYLEIIKKFKIQKKNFVFNENKKLNINFDENLIFLKKKILDNLINKKKNDNY